MKQIIRITDSYIPSTAEKGGELTKLVWPSSSQKHTFLEIEWIKQFSLIVKSHIYL